MTRTKQRQLPASAPSATPAPAADAAAATPAPARGFVVEEDSFGDRLPEYDPAEYRWVPVRRRPRHDGWTEEKQRRFIEVLADTGLVGVAAKEVGMTRMSAYRLRRAPHAGAFARAWDLARERAGTLLEDIAFERAIEGVEVETYDGSGELASTRTVYNDRLLRFMLGQLKPERYSAAARERRGGAWPPGQGASEVSLDAALRAMEPAPPAPPETLVDNGDLVNDLLVADIVDGTLPHHLTEQRAPKTPERLRAEEAADRHDFRERAYDKDERGEDLSAEEFTALCEYLDPSQIPRVRKKRRPVR